MLKFGIEIAITMKCLSFGCDLTELRALENHVLSMHFRVLFLPSKLVKGAAKRICCEHLKLYSMKLEKDIGLKQQGHMGLEKEQKTS